MDNPSNINVQVGETLVGFRLTHRLGEGGVAVIFRAENVLDSTILRALKVVRPELAAYPEFATRFAEEGRILERLAHPNVVRFFGIRRERGFLVMELELLQGQALGYILASATRPFNFQDVVSWGMQAADGVGAAHALGVVHRDIKPANLFLTTDRVVKVVDFGVARALDEAQRAARATAVGTTPGTPAYIAPEIWGGSVPGAQGDVYALGLSMLELLTGHHPFAQPGGRPRSAAEMMLAHLKQDIPRLRASRPDAPEALDYVLAQATARNPAARFPSGREFAEALRRVAQGQYAVPPAAHVAHAAPAAHQLLHLTPPSPQGAQRGPLPGTSFEIPHFGTGPATGNEPPTPNDSDPPAVPKKKSPVALIVGLAAGVVVLGAGGLAVTNQMAGSSRAAANPSASASAASTAATESPGSSKNRWLRIEPAPANLSKPVRLGVSDDKTNGAGFRPSRNVHAPGSAYDIQQHEVTWEELTPFIAAHPDAKFDAPKWTPSEPKRDSLPATGVPWPTAFAYCKAQGGTLPTEEQWEFAARGPELRPHPWGTEAVDLARTNAYRGKKAASGAVPPTKPVMTSDQDQTPGDETHALMDMAGNALEWTLDIYREDAAGQDESWVQADGLTFRAVRGLPIGEPLPKTLPRSTAAYRQALCATGPCPKDTGALTQFVGFRCVRHAAAKGP